MRTVFVIGWIVSALAGIRALYRDYKHNEATTGVWIAIAFMQICFFGMKLFD